MLFAIILKAGRSWQVFLTWLLLGMAGKSAQEDESGELGAWESELQTPLVPLMTSHIGKQCSH